MTRPRTVLACTLAAAALGLAAAPVAGAQGTGTTPQTCDQSFSQPAPGTGGAGAGAGSQPGGTDPNFAADNGDPNFQAGPTYGPEWYSGVPCTNPGTPTRTSPPGPLENVTGVLGGLVG